MLRDVKQLRVGSACIVFLALLGLQVAYAASYVANVYSESDLNLQLQTAQAIANSNVRIIFKSASAVYKLSAAYTILYTVHLDAASLPGGVRLRAAKGQHHFNVSEAMLYRGNLTAVNITFENAYKISSTTTVDGGSIVVSGDLTTYNCTFTNNTAAASEARGGAIAASLQAKVRLYNTRFYGNTASAQRNLAAGGALYARLDSGGKVLIDGCDFRGNRVAGSSLVYGASLAGGALDITGGDVQVVNTRFFKNVVQVSGGSAVGIFSGGAVSLWSVASCEFNASQFESNQLSINSTGLNPSDPATAFGGALYISESSCNLCSVTFSSNTIKGVSRGGVGYIWSYGGAVFFEAASAARRVRLMSCRFLVNGLSITGPGEGYGGAVGARATVELSLSLCGRSQSSLFSNNWINSTGWKDDAYQAHGGALYYVGPALDVSNATFRDNSIFAQATGAADIMATGGAVCSIGTSSNARLSFQSTAFLRNRASVDVRSAAAAGRVAEVRGGALFAGSDDTLFGGTLNLTGCSFTSNSAYLKGTSVTTHSVFGGAMALYGTSLIIEVNGGAFTQNSANASTVSFGGAVYTAFTQNITFRKTDFRRNIVALVGATGNGNAHGAVIYAKRTSVLLESCTLVSNRALNSGYNAFSFGAVYGYEVYRLKLYACTFLDNNANKGQSPGALYAYGWPNGGSVVSQVSVKACTISGPESNVMGFEARCALDCTDTSSSGAITVSSWSGSLPVCYGSPTKAPTVNPEVSTNAPTRLPTSAPTPLTAAPTRLPSTSPTTSPTLGPTQPLTTAPTVAPTRVPTGWPSSEPPTTAPTVTNLLTTSPTAAPSNLPTTTPVLATASPTLLPTILPTSLATYQPSVHPTVLPTRVPTTPPSTAPAVALTNTTYSIQLRSVHHVRGGQIVVNKQDLSLQVFPSIARSDGAAVWRSANSSLLRATGEGGGLLTPSLATSFLVVSGAALLEGRTYVITVSATSFWVDSQVILTVNRAPKGGSLTISPMTGQAILTTFNATCAGWRDTDLPLAYLYTAQMPGSSLPLAGPTDESRLQTTLPPSANLTFRVGVMDALGASTLATCTSISVTRLANASKALSVLSTLELQVDANRSSSLPTKLDNSTATRLVSMLGVVTRALTAMPEPVAPALETRILRLMNASLQVVSLDISRAEALGDVLQALATQEIVEAPARDLLELTRTFTEQVQEQVGAISPALTLSVLDAIDGVIRFRNALTPIEEGVGAQSERISVVNITSPSACALVDESSQRMDKILDSVHGLIVSELSPGQAAAEYATPSQSLASQTQTLETLGMEGGLQLDSSLERGIRFSLNASALGSASLHILLPNQTMTIKKVDWTQNRRPCADINNLVGVTEDSSVVTAGIGQIDIRLPQAQSAMKLSFLAPPLEASIGYDATVTGTVACSQGERVTKEVRCPGPASIIVSVECNCKAETVTAVCPAPMPACVFWNETEQAWSKEGVTTRGFQNGRLICESTHASEFTVLVYATGQLWMLSDALRNPEWMKKDRSVILVVGALYVIFLIVLLTARHKKHVDDKHFADGVASRLFYTDAAACLGSLDQDGIPDRKFGAGEHFSHRRHLNRPLDSVVSELTGRRIAALQMGHGSAAKNGQVSNELLAFSLSAQLGPTWQQRRLWLFLRCLTIVFLCALLYGSSSSKFIAAVIHGDQLTSEMAIEQFSVALQGALIAFPPSILVQVLTNIINRKAREDLQLEEELDLPFYLPSTVDKLDEGTYFSALRVAIKQLELTRRALIYDIRARQQKDRKLDHKRINMIVSTTHALTGFKRRYLRELSASVRKRGVSSCMLSWVVYWLPLEVTGRLSIPNEIDVEKIIEAEYDVWVTNKLKKQGRLGPLLSWYYRSWIAPPVSKGPGSGGLPWGYMLSCTCLLVYALVLTLSTVMLSMSYTSRDALAVLFGCLLTFATDIVTMSGLQYMLRLLGMALSRQLIDHIFIFRLPFLEYAGGERDAVTGATLDAVKGEQRQKVKLSFGHSKKVLVGSSKAAQGGDVDDYAGRDVQVPSLLLPAEGSKDPSVGPASRLSPPPAIITSAGSISPTNDGSGKSLLRSPRAASAAYSEAPGLTWEPEALPEGHSGGAHGRRSSARRASALASPRIHRVGVLPGAGAGEDEKGEDDRRRRRKSERLISPPMVEAQHNMSGKGRRRSRRVVPISGEEEGAGAEGGRSPRGSMGTGKTESLWHARRKSARREVPQEGDDAQGQGLGQQEEGVDTREVNADLEPEVLMDWQPISEDGFEQDLMDEGEGGAGAENRRGRGRRRSSRSPMAREDRRSSKSHR